MIRQKLVDLASIFRSAIEAAKASGEFDADSAFSCFPAGCCRDASELLGRYFLEHQIESKLVCGNYYFNDPEKPPQTHAWLLVGDLIVDITGDQFSNNTLFCNYAEKVYVGSGDAFHGLFQIDEQDICTISELIGSVETNPRMFDLYYRIKRYL